MKEDFFKFPTTPHLALLGDVDIRDDKVMSESERNDFLRHELVVEEKVDGANLGISFGANQDIRAQNRGTCLQLPGSGQWKKLGEWLASRTDVLFENLTDRYILFGEWCYAQHSVFYSRLSDWFLAFDVYDKQVGRFLSTSHRDDLLQAMHVAQVPTIARGRFNLLDLKNLLSLSKFSDQLSEGLYFRLEKDDWLAQRAKLVRSEFIQSVGQHWSRSSLRKNQLGSEDGE